MKKLSTKLKAILMIAIVTLIASKSQAAVIVVQSNITTNTTWSSSNVYQLKGYVYVTNNAILTIGAGTLIVGDSVTKGCLIVTRGAKLNAIGTACKPIVFTSSKSVNNRNRGDWGGIILLGYASINQLGDTAHIEGITTNPLTLYGGGLNPNCGGGNCPNDNDNSGTLSYVRIEYPGIALSPNSEINGLTCGGVGSGTTLDHIQISYSNDDAYEFFGGTVNAKHLVAFRTLDDDFDTDNGYRGKLQFLVGLRDPNVADISGSNGFESDNDAAGSTNLPQTNPIFSNVTWLAGADTTNNVNFKRNVHIRRNSKMRIYNSILMGNIIGLYIDGAATEGSILSDTLLINNINANKWTPNFVISTPVDANVNSLLLSANDFYNGNAGVKLNNPYLLTNPDFQPIAGSPANGTSEFNHAGLNDPFFTEVSYRGAFDGTNDWTGDWVNWNPNATNYFNTGKIDYTPTITAVITKKTCPNSGSVDVTVSNGISPFSYTWSNNSTTQDISGLNNGSYTVTVSDEGKNCKKTKSFTVGINKVLFTSCTPTASSITVFWSNSIQSQVTGYIIRYKKHSVTTWGAWTTIGLVTSRTFTGLLSNTQYDFQIAGKCSSTTYTSNSAIYSCNTSIVRLEETAVSSSVNIYPNPSTGDFRIELGNLNNNNVNVKITNVAGQIVYTAENEIVEGNALNVHLENVAEGIYFVQITDGTNVFVKHLNIVKP